MVKQSPEFFMNLFDASLQARRNGDTGSVKVEPYLLGSEAFKLDLPTYIGRGCERLRLTYAEKNSRYGINLVPVIGVRSDGMSVTYISSEYGRDYKLVPHDYGEVHQLILSSICKLLPLQEPEQPIEQQIPNFVNPNGQEAA